MVFAVVMHSICMLQYMTIESEKHICSNSMRLKFKIELGAHLFVKRKSSGKNLLPEDHELGIPCKFPFADNVGLARFLF